MEEKGFKEKSVKHHSGDMPLKIYHMTGRTAVPLHWHDEYELIYVTAGGCECGLDNHSISLRTGDLVLVNPGVVHMINSDAGCSFSSIVFHPFLVSSADCAKYFNSFFFKSIHRAADAVTSRIGKSALEIITAYEKRNIAYELIIKDRILEIFIALFENGCYCKSEDINTNGKTDTTVKSMLNYIHENYPQQITLRSLSELTNYSISYITRVFKRNTGKTPAEYITYYRVCKAGELLCKTKISVLDAALNVGFNSVGYFINCFKSYYGVTPFKYRKHSEDAEI